MKRSILASLIFFLCSFPTIAEPSETPTQPAQSANLDEVVVTATRLPTPAKELPVPVQVITRKEIQESRADDLATLLTEKLPEHFQKYPGALSSITIRGFSSDTTGTDIKGHVLVLIDGHRSGTGNIASIPLENVERVEVVRGPGSVVYGSSAMGGVVNIITRRGKGEPSSEAGAEYGSNDYVKGHAGFSGGLFDERIGLSVTARTVTQGSYERGSGQLVPNTGYNDEAYSASLLARVAPDHSVFAVGNFYRAWDVGYPDASYAPAASLDNTKNIVRGYGSIDYDGALPDLGINWRLGYYRVEDRNRWDNPTGDWGYFATTTEANTQGALAQVNFPTFSFGQLLLGFSWDGTDISNYTNPEGSSWTPDSRYDNYAVFAEEKVKWEKLTLTLGIRYDFFQEDILPTTGLDVVQKSQDFGHASWRTGLTYSFLDWLTGRVAVGTAFRAPTADELAGRFQMGGWTKVVGNPDLKPETGTTYDIGLDAQVGGFKAGLGFFYTDYSNRISAGFPACVDGDCTWTTSRNVNGAILSAIEGNVSYKKSFTVSDAALSLKPFVNFVYYTQRNLEDETYSRTLRTSVVPYVPLWDATGGIEVGIGKKTTFTFTGFYTGDEKQEDFNWLSPTYTQAIDKGGFVIFSARATYRPSKYLELFLVTDNLTDRDYSYVDGYPMPGRTFRGGITAHF